MALSSLKEIIARLRVRGSRDEPSGAGGVDTGVGDTSAGGTHLNAYEAEGLLGVLDFIIKVRSN